MASTEVFNTKISVPDIVITEPSPLIQNESVVLVSADGKIPHTVPTHREYSNEVKAPSEQGATNSSQEPSASITKQLEDSSGDFSPAEACVDCVVPVPEVQPELPQNEPEPSTESTATDLDEFRTSRCCNLENIEFGDIYLLLWNAFESRYGIAFWLMAMGSPLSAGIMGSLYMFSCPMIDSFPSMILMIGICLMAVLTLRVCIILHRITLADENTRSMLQTINIICLFVTSIFFITETVSFWQMHPSTHPGAKNYCHPTFYNYTYWWNIASSILMILIFIFPIA